MDQQSAQLFTDQERDDVYRDLFMTVYNGLESGEVTEDVAQRAAQYILSHLDTLKTHQELLTFLEALANQFPFYSNVYLMKKDEFMSSQKAEQIQQQLDSMGGSN